MADARVVKHAKILVNYSLRIKKGDYLLIQGSDVATELIREVYREAIKQGAHVDVMTKIPGVDEIFYKEASEEQLEFVSPFEEFMSKHYDAMLTIMGGHNTKTLTNIDSEKIQKRSIARREVWVRFINRMEKDLRWCGTAHPTYSGAQDANMSLEDYEDFVYGACLIEEEDPVSKWREQSVKQEKICSYLNTKKTLHIKSKDTDLRMKIEGRKWINCDGMLNFPDGEVYTTPLEDSVEGTIRFSYPGIFRGREIEDITLEFKNGKVVNASAVKGEDLLKSLIETDEGAKILGEIAIGTNYGIDTFTKNMLFDEKIGGTIHAALGSAPKNTGGKNESGIHWDLLCDLKVGGEIYADDELIYKDGKFVAKIEKLKQ